MKRTISLLAAIMLLLTACGGSSTSVEGTWYSVSDASMCNFTEGKITVSGVTVGQYEDNGDSVVISLMDGSQNLQLFVTNMNKIDVLADVKKGEGNIYFCKGLENAHAFIENRLIEEFKAYLNEHLAGRWEVWDPQETDAMDFVEFSDDLIQTTNTNGKTTDYHVNSIEYKVEDGEPRAVFNTYFGGKKENAMTIELSPIEISLKGETIRMDSDRILRKIG